jgi:hypothetical protein
MFAAIHRTEHSKYAERIDFDQWLSAGENP